MEVAAVMKIDSRNLSSIALLFWRIHGAKTTGK